MKKTSPPFLPRPYAVPSNRYYSPTRFSKDEPITLTGDEAHHLLRVMRTKTHEEIEVVNGYGELAIASLQKIVKDSAELKIVSISYEEPGPQIILAQAIPRNNRLEYILEKGTELGASSFWLFPSINSEKEIFSHNQQHRQEQILISAMKQCGRLHLASRLVKPDLLSWESIDGTLLFGDTRKQAPPLSHALHKPIKEPLVLFIGPESGFHPKEIQFLEERLCAKGVSLHHNILRVDTAAIAALSVISSLL